MRQGLAILSARGLEVDWQGKAAVRIDAHRGVPLTQALAFQPDRHALRRQLDPQTLAGFPDDLHTTLATSTEAVHRLQVDSAHTLADIDRLANESRSQIATNGQDLDDLLKRAEEVTGRADTLFVSLNDMTSLRGDLQASLRDLAASAGSLRGLTHDLERNPLGTLLRRSE